MKLFVCTVIAVIKDNLTLPFDSLIKNFNRVKQLRILCLHYGKTADMAYLGFEISVGQALNLLYQCFTLAVRYML